MGDKLKQEMMSYYDEIAQEYDEIYLGECSAVPADPVAYKNDTTRISKMVSAF